MERGSQKNLEEQALKSSPTFSTSLNLGHMPSTDISIVQEHFEQIYPVFNISDSPILEFYIPGSSTHYTDLSNIFLAIRAKCTNKDGTKLATDSATCPANTPFSTMFQNLEVLIQNVGTCSGSGNYAYTAMIEKIINNNLQSVNTKMRTEHMYRETSATAVDALNNAYVNLKKIAQGGDWECYSVISHPLFSQIRMLPPNISVRIRLRRSPNTFCMLSTLPAGNAAFTDQLVIIDSFLDVKRVVVNSKIQQMHESILSKGGGNYFGH